MAMTYMIALLDGEAAGLWETEERLRLYEKGHPGYGMEIACFMETAPFMEAVCGGLEDGERAFHILFMDISMPVGALYYLVSPVSREKLDRAVEKAVREVRHGYFA